MAHSWLTVYNPPFFQDSDEALMREGGEERQSNILYCILDPAPP